MELQELKLYYKEVREQLSNVIPLGDILDVRLCNSVNYLGRCRRIHKQNITKGFIIFINKNINDKELAKTTIAHELIHTCPGCFNHGHIYLKNMRIVNSLGYKVNIQAEESKEINQIRQDRYKYTIYCECGFSTQRIRKMKVEKYKCPKCGGALHIKQSAD